RPHLPPAPRRGRRHRARRADRRPERRLSPGRSGMGVELSITTLLLLALAAFAAGWVDSVVGGGGLIQLPALLLVPGMTPLQAVATNKIGSIMGTSVSSLTYYRRIRPDLRTALPMAGAALVAAILGA